MSWKHVVVVVAALAAVVLNYGLHLGLPEWLVAGLAGVAGVALPQPGKRAGG